MTFLVAEHGLQGALDSVVAARGLSVCGFLGSSQILIDFATVCLWPLYLKVSLVAYQQPWLTFSFP